MAQIQAHVGNDVLVFPEGTDKAVIDREVKRFVNSRRKPVVGEPGNAAIPQDESHLGVYRALGRATEIKPYTWRNTARGYLSALPYVGGAFGGLVGAGATIEAGGAGGVPGAVLGGGAGEAAKQLGLRALRVPNVPGTSEEAASQIAESGATMGWLELFGELISPLLAGIPEGLRGFPTLGRRIAGTQTIKRAATELGQEISKTTAAEVLPGRSAQLLSKAESEHAARLGEIGKIVAATRESLEEEALSITKVPSAPGSPSDYSIGRNVVKSILAQRSRLAKLVENHGYTDLYRLADQAGVSVRLSQATLAAEKVIDPEVFAQTTGASSVASQALEVGERIATPLEKMAPSAISESYSKQIFGRPTGLLSAGQRAHLEAALSISSRPEAKHFTGRLSFEQVHRLVAGINSGISRLLKSGAEVEGSPTLRALGAYRNALNADLEASLKENPELKELYGDMRAVTRERKAYFSRPDIKAAVKQVGARPYERTAAIFGEKGAVTRPQNLLRGLSRGQALETALSRYQGITEIQSLASRAERVAYEVRGQVGKSAVLRVIGSGTSNFGRDFDASKALEFMEQRPSLRAQMGSDAYDNLQATFNRQRIAQETLKARFDTLTHVEQSATASEKYAQAEAMGSRYNKFLRDSTKAGNLDRFLDRIGSNRQEAATAKQALGPDSTALARSIVDRIVDRSTRGKQFNPGLFGRNLQAALPSIKELSSPSDVQSLANLADSLTTVSRNIALMGREKITAVERSGPVRLYGLTNRISEVLTGRPASEAYIRPVHLKKIIRDPRLMELLGIVVRAKPGKIDRVVRTASFALAYALSIINDNAGD